MLTDAFVVFTPASVPEKNTASAGAPKPSESHRVTRTTENISQPIVNPNLDSFEAVMQAMDAELARSRSKSSAPKTSLKPKDKGKAKAAADDVEVDMDSELRALLETAESDDEDEDAEADVDYSLIKNFLESFKSQAGLSGPVSNLAGRLQPEWQLPRDSA